MSPLTPDAADLTAVVIAASSAWALGRVASVPVVLSGRRKAAVIALGAVCAAALITIAALFFLWAVAL